MNKLTTTEGKVYALKSDFSIYGKEIILGANDKEENWEKIDEAYTNWHEPTFSIQIKLTHKQNSTLIIDFPQFAFLPNQLQLPVHSDDDFVYIYANFLNEEHRNILSQYSEITERT